MDQDGCVPPTEGNKVLLYGKYHFTWKPDRCRSASVDANNLFKDSNGVCTRVCVCLCYCVCVRVSVVLHVCAAHMCMIVLVAATISRLQVYMGTRSQTAFADIS